MCPFTESTPSIGRTVHFETEMFIVSEPCSSNATCQSISSIGSSSRIDLFLAVCVCVVFRVIGDTDAKVDSPSHNVSIHNPFLVSSSFVYCFNGPFKLCPARRPDDVCPSLNRFSQTSDKLYAQRSARGERVCA